MKKVLWKVATCIAVVLMSFSVYSCGDDDDENVGSVEEIVGVWEGVTSDEWAVEDGVREEENGKDITDERYEFKSDMTFELLHKSGGTWHVSETGKWEHKSNTISLYYYYPNDGGYDYEEPDVFKILEFSAASMTLEYYWKEPGLELYAKMRYRKIS